MSYKVTVTEIHTPSSAGDTEKAPAPVPHTEVYSQTLPELNLPALIKALNPTTRKRRKNAKEVAS